jgi:hypothetical protein
LFLAALFFLGLMFAPVWFDNCDTPCWIDIENFVGKQLAVSS